MAQNQAYDRDSSPISTDSSRITVHDVKKETNVFMAALKGITVEPALLVYMISSFLHFPVFQSLIYEKACLDLYDQDAGLCNNDTATHKDQGIHTLTNFVFTLSQTCLTVPSVFATIFLGSYGDRRSRKLALLAPYVGLVLADVSYIVQSTYMNWSVYYLLISDCVFGLFGGYSSIIGTSFSYGAQETARTNRSYRMAVLEGSIGVGGTLGYLFSGIVLKAAGYRIVFSINLVLHCMSFVYICIRATDSREQSERRRGLRRVPAEDDERTTNPAMNIANTRISDEDGNCCWWIFAYFRDAISVLKKRSGNRRSIVVAILVAFSVSFLVFSGSQDIMLYYLKYTLQWTPTTYGIFRGVYFGTSSAAILFIFPLLKYRGLNDWILAAIGLLSRLIGSLMLCFPFSTWFVFCVSIFYMFNRFAATGMRSIASKQVDKDEQGKLFAAIALIESICTLFASLIFNNLYSLSLSFYPGFCYAIMATLMIIPLVLVFYVGYRLNRSDDPIIRKEESETQDSNDSST